MTARDLRDHRDRTDNSRNSNRVVKLTVKGGMMPETLYEGWYVFQIVTRVRANTEEDAFRLMYPALETLQKLDATRLEPQVELLVRQEPHTVQRVPLPLAEVPPQYGVS